MRISDWSSDVCSSDLTLMDLMGSESGRSRIDLDLLIERVMIFAAERSSTTVMDAKSYLDPLVGMLTPFGNVTAQGEDKDNGFLYLQHVRLLHFRNEVASYRGQVREELDHLVGQIVEAADECIRSEEHTSELQSLMRISYAVF